eukprot:90738_1
MATRTSEKTKDLYLKHGSALIHDVGVRDKNLVEGTWKIKRWYEIGFKAFEWEQNYTCFKQKHDVNITEHAYFKMCQSVKNSNGHGNRLGFSRFTLYLTFYSLYTYNGLKEVLEAGGQELQISNLDKVVQQFKRTGSVQSKQEYMQKINTNHNHNRNNNTGNATTTVYSTRFTRKSKSSNQRNSQKRTRSENANSSSENANPHKKRKKTSKKNKKYWKKQAKKNKAIIEEKDKEIEAKNTEIQDLKNEIIVLKGDC